MNLNRSNNNLNMNVNKRTNTTIKRQCYHLLWHHQLLLMSCHLNVYFQTSNQHFGNNIATSMKQTCIRTANSISFHTLYPLLFFLIFQIIIEKNFKLVYSV
jgi:hypothetical protein